MSKDDFVKNYITAFQSQLNEEELMLERIEGHLPDNLRGTFYRAGVGRMHRGDFTYPHIFDGDGMIASFTFSADGVSYINRHVRTKGFVIEEQAGLPVYRNLGQESKIKKTSFKNYIVKNTSNTNVIWHANKLLSLWEGGLPYEIDPVSLKTISEFDFSGRLRSKWSLLNRNKPFSAHPKKIINSNVLYSFGVRYGISTTLFLYEVDESCNLNVTREIKLKHNYFVHDMAVTKNYCVFFLCAFEVKKTFVSAVMKKSLVDNISRMPTISGCILIVPHNKRREPFYINSADGFIFHVANGYEESEHVLIVDATKWNEFPHFIPSRYILKTNNASLARYEIDIEKRTVREFSFNVKLEFPVVNPGFSGEKHRYVWGCNIPQAINAGGVFRLIKLNALDNSSVFRDLSPDIPDEPLMVQAAGSPDEDNGWLLVLLYVVELHCSELLILSAKDLTTICRYRLPHHLPPGFHHTWVGE